MYYIEFSPIQNGFHIDTMERIKEHNIESIKREITPGYIVIAGPFNTIDEACSESDKFEFLRKRKVDYATQD